MRTIRYWPRPHRRTDADGGLWIDGEFFMGRNRVPPMPVRMALVDRVTGIPLVLSDTGGTSPGIQLVAIASTMRDVHIYDKQEGPYDGTWRLFLSNGVLAFERVALTGPGGVPRESFASPLILTRNAFNTTCLRITANQATGVVVYTTYIL